MTARIASIGTVNYELPFGSNKRWATSGWKKYASVDSKSLAIQTLESGNPLDVQLYRTARTITIQDSPATPGRTSSARWRSAMAGYDLGGDRFSTGNSQFRIHRRAITASMLSLFQAAARAVIPAGFDRASAISASAIRAEYRDRIRLCGGRPDVRAEELPDSRSARRFNCAGICRTSFKTYQFQHPRSRTVDFRNVAQFGKVSSDPTTASFGGQPLMNLTLMVQF